MHSAYAIVNDATFTENTAFDGGAVGLSGVKDGLLTGVNALRGVFINNQLTGGDGGLAYIDGSLDDDLSVFLNDSTWLNNAMLTLEWVDEMGVAGGDSPPSGVDATCTPAGGC